MKRGLLYIVCTVVVAIYFCLSINEILVMAEKIENSLLKENLIFADLVGKKDNLLEDEYLGVSWKWDESTQTVIFDGGNFENITKQNNIATLIEKNEILQGKKIKKILFTKPVVLSGSVSYLFAYLSELILIEGEEYFNTSNVINMDYMFYKTSGLKTVNVSKWDTSNVVNMSYMFSYVSDLQYLDVSNWQLNKVKNLSGMFSYVGKLSTIDVSKWNVSSATNLSAMFYRATNLESIDVSQWNTAQVTNMSEMFFAAKKLSNINVSQWNTSNVINLYGMFQDAHSIKILDLSNWETTNVENMKAMCDGLNGLQLLILGENTQLTMDISLTENITYPYSGRWIHKETETIYESVAEFLTNYDEAGQYIRETYSTDSYQSSQWIWQENTQSVIFGKGAIQEINRQNNIAEKIEKNERLEGKKIKEIIFTEPIILNGQVSHLFSNLSELTCITGAEYLDTSNVTDMSYMFYKTTRLETLDISQWQTENVTNMAYLFNGMTMIQELDLSGWVISESTNLQSMLGEAPKLDTLKLGSRSQLTTAISLSENSQYPYSGQWIDKTVETKYSSAVNLLVNYSGAGEYTREIYAKENYYSIPWTWDEKNQTIIFDQGSIQNVTTKTNIATLVEQDERLNGKKIKGIIFTKPVVLQGDMSYLFANLNELTQIKGAEYLDTSKVTNMYGMFSNADQLVNIDFSQWDTARVKNMSYMFCGADNLLNVDLSQWRTEEVVSAYNMFTVTIDLKNIKLNENIQEKMYLFGNEKKVNINGFQQEYILAMNDVVPTNLKKKSTHLKNINTQPVKTWAIPLVSMLLSQ